MSFEKNHIVLKIEDVSCLSRLKKIGRFGSIVDWILFHKPAAAIKTFEHHCATKTAICMLPCDQAFSPSCQMCVLVNFKLSVKRIIKRQYLGPLSDISIKILVIIGTKGFWTRPSGRRQNLHEELAYIELYSTVKDVLVHVSLCQTKRLIKCLVGIVYYLSKDK